MFPLSLLFGHLITTGTLTIEDAAGRRADFGNGKPPHVTIKVHRRGTAWRILLRPAMAVGEGYMNGDLTVESGDIKDFLDLIAMNTGRAAESQKRKVWDSAAWQRVRHFNYQRRARRNIATHYEFTTEAYDLFLDEARQYSCAYFKSPDDSLEQAQQNKMDHVAAKLLLGPDHRVLDIGCGWGGLARRIHDLSGARVTGLTLSEEQARAARQMAEETGLSDMLDFRVEDYRAITGRFDRIVSVGMFEHVGPPFYPAYFRKIRELLADDGVALVHTIGRTDGPGGTNAWTAKYIFPGGYSPALSEIVPVIEREGLILADIEVLRLHYARTAEHWYRRVQQNRDQLKALYDERFCRMFEFFLAGCVGAFEHGGLVVYQMQLARRQDAVPLTRQYLYRD
ncbi:MAG: class I SAM-dependent methyltransferase [Alphaproteobacteria bacterium]